MRHNTLEQNQTGLRGLVTPAQTPGAGWWARLLGDSSELQAGHLPPTPSPSLGALYF